jgi:hypothetical protein
MKTAVATGFSILALSFAMSCSGMGKRQSEKYDKTHCEHCSKCENCTQQKKRECKECGESCDCEKCNCG